VLSSSQTPKYKKQKKYAEGESDLDENAVAEHEERCKAREIEKAEKRLAKDNEKLVQEGKPVQDKGRSPCAAEHDRG
jgi:DNA topoisomerase-1